MKSYFYQFVVRHVRAPIEINIEKDIEWFCESFGFKEPRDNSGTAISIFRQLLKTVHDDNGLTSTQISEQVGVTRGAVLHHLEKFQDSGIIIKRGQAYSLRTINLGEMVKEVEEDIKRTLEHIHDIATEIDDQLKLPKRRLVENDKR